MNIKKSLFATGLIFITSGCAISVGIAIDKPTENVQTAQSQKQNEIASIQSQIDKFKSVDLKTSNQNQTVGTLRQEILAKLIVLAQENIDVANTRNANHYLDLATQLTQLPAKPIKPGVYYSQSAIDERNTVLEQAFSSDQLTSATGD